MAEWVETAYRIKVVRHRRTGLMVALSPDLPGLMVHGRDDDELRQRIPGSIREILEAQGFRVRDVGLDDGDDGLDNFIVQPQRATAHYQAGV